MSNTDLGSFSSLGSCVLDQSKLNKISIRRSKLPKDFFSIKQNINTSFVDSLEGISTVDNSPRVNTPTFRQSQNKKDK